LYLKPYLVIIYEEFLVVDLFFKKKPYFLGRRRVRSGDQGVGKQPLAGYILVFLGVRSCFILFGSLV
jgi:hypothetical protein